MSSLYIHSRNLFTWERRDDSLFLHFLRDILCERCRSIVIHSLHDATFSVQVCENYYMIHSVEIGNSLIDII